VHCGWDELPRADSVLGISGCLRETASCCLREKKCCMGLHQIFCQCYSDASTSLTLTSQRGDTSSNWYLMRNIQSLGSQLIPVSWQSTHRWLSHKPGGRLPLLLPGPQLPLQPKTTTVPWPVPNYSALWQRQTFVNSLCRATTQWCAARTRTYDLWIASPTYR